MFKRRKKSYVSIELKDYALRAIVAKGNASSQWQCYELPLAPGIIENGTIIDELLFFEILKTQVIKWTGKNQPVRIFVPDTTVLFKNFEYAQDTVTTELRGYVEMEIGRSIHLPFQEPLIDVYDPVQDDGKAILFAAPSEEINKMIGMLLDVALEPVAVDIRALCNLRLLEYLNLLTVEKTYLIADWSINDLSICIFSKGYVEFLRYQSIKTDLTQSLSKKEDDSGYTSIVMEQVIEIERIMNFFKFSLHKGERSVDEIVVLGDNSRLEIIGELLTTNLGISLTMIDDNIVQQHFPKFNAKFSTLLGLTLKEEN